CASYTLDVAYPLLLFAWLFYSLEGARHGAATRALAQLSLLTGAFAAVYFGFRFLVEYMLHIHVGVSAASNDPFARIQEQLRSLGAHGWGGWAAEQLRALAMRWPP